MESYYVTAVVTREMTSDEEKQIVVPGRIYVARCKTTVMAANPQAALSSGMQHITDSFAGSGLHLSDFGCMPVAAADKLGDFEIYAKYPTPDEVLSLCRKNV